MAIEFSTTLLKQVSALFQLGTLTGLADGALLDRFRLGPAEEAEAAFAALVDRHGPMVMQVCRRILGDRHDAEDAAQATFLVLARQARAIRRGDSVASWLYGTAARVAGQARRDAARRRARERRGAEAAMMNRRAESEGTGGSEAWPELYEELGRLPDRFRLPVLLCHLEGLSYEQASQRLGCPVRTVQSRLARAREKLRARLVRRGFGSDSVAGIVAVAMRLDASWTSTALSETWKQTTVTAAVRYAAGETAATLVSGSVAALIEGATRAMNLQRLLRAAAAVFLIGAVACGAGMGLLARTEPPPPEAEPGTAAVADDNPYLATFQNGATVEVVAVSTVPTGPKTWWKPDGSPLAEAPVDTIEWRLPANEKQPARVILVRSSGIHKGDMFRWHPTRAGKYWGGRPTKNGGPAPEWDDYAATFGRDQADCEVQIRVATGAWKTETSTRGEGGTGNVVNGHKFCYGKARAYQAYGRSLTAIAVAHNFLGQDRRLVAVDRDGKIHPSIYSTGSDGDPRWVLDQIDAEFDLPPNRIREFQVQFRPYEEAEIKGIALKPQPASASTSKPRTESPRPKTDPAADSDGDGLTDLQEIHKYRTDPARFSDTLVPRNEVPGYEWKTRGRVTIAKGR